MKEKLKQLFKIVGGERVAIDINIFEEVCEGVSEITNKEVEEIKSRGGFWKLNA